MLTCMASLARLGTLSITSKPSFISPFPSSQHVSNSCSQTHLHQHTHRHKHTHLVQQTDWDQVKTEQKHWVSTFSKSWYLVILWTGLIRYDEIELASPCLRCISCEKQHKITFYCINDNKNRLTQPSWPKMVFSWSPFLVKLVFSWLASWSVPKTSTQNPFKSLKKDLFTTLCKLFVFFTSV